MRTGSQQHYKLRSLAQSLVKRVPLDALKVSPPNLPLSYHDSRPIVQNKLKGRVTYLANQSHCESG